jgi:nucleoside-diphosphate-sugar epimerase
MNARTPTVLVTGSNGYLGYALARRLSERYAVVGFDRRAPSHPPPSAECVYVDLTSDASLRRGLETVRDLHGDRLGSALVGAWVVAAPWVFGTTGSAFSFDSVVGALAIVVAFVAWAEVARVARLLNVAIGLAVALAPWFLPDVSLAARVSDLVASALLIGLSVPRGPVRDRYGSWDPFVV